MKLQKLGGYAAIASVCFFIIRNIVQGPLSMDAAKAMAAFSARPAHIVVVFLLFIIGSILTFVMFLALHERMKADAVYLTRIMLIAASALVAVWIATSIVFLMGGGIILPTQDVSAFRALFAMGLSLGMMGHHAQGWAFLLLGCAVLKARSFSRILGWLSLFAGIIWIPTSIVPQLFRAIQLEGIPSIANLLSFVSAVWIGIALLRQKQSQPAAKEMAASR